MPNKTTLLLIAAGAALLVWGVRQAAGAVAETAQETAQAVGGAIDPTSQENIFYRGVSAVVDILDDGQGNESNTLGTWIYDLVHGD